MRKIRFYHYWIYKLYFYLWTPILAERPHYVYNMIVWMQSYMDHHYPNYGETKNVPRTKD
jgi:hypothetical protein